MKHLLCIYSVDCDYVCWQHMSFKGRPQTEEMSFPRGTSDHEVIEAARALELERLWEDQNCAGECYTTRTLVKIFEIGRELNLLSR